MDKRIQKTRNAIREAYFSLLLQKKNAHITITEIAKTANIDRKTFYLHYDSVTDVSREFCEEKIQDLLFELKKDDFFERPFDTAGLFRTLNNQVEQDLDFYQRVAQEHVYDFFWEQLQDIICSTLQDVYLPETELPLEQFKVCAQFFAAGLISVYRNWLIKNSHSLDINTLGQVIGNTAYYGLQTIFSHPAFTKEINEWTIL